ncbi:SDR family NAD(P)-dependent oxidoreductase [Pseudoalteromonas xiamenensis]
MSLLKDKKGMIVGATSGIGRAAATLFAKEGAEVVVIGRRAELLESLVSEIKEAGGKAHYIVADIAKSDDIKRMTDEAQTLLGRLDFAFNNAGTIGNFAPIFDQSEADWDHTIGTNLKAVWLSIKEQATAMRAHGGAIVNTSSWLSNGGLIGSTAYSASKAGMDGIIRPAALELAQYGIRINNINPGGVDTEMTREAFQHDEQVLSTFAKSHPLGKLASSEEIAELAAYLLSDRARNITGQAIFTDGGYAIAGQRG